MRRHVGDIVNWLNQHRDAYCTTMFDLYGLPQNFPRRSGMDRNLHPYEKVSYLENAFARDIDNGRFIPYIQLHEFEALLFAGIDKMKVFYLDEKNQAIERLVKVANSFDSPELINEGNETAPSKRIASVIPEYRDEKGRRNPPNLSKIEEIAKVLGLSQEEKEAMIDMASEDRDEIPMDLPDYIKDSDLALRANVVNEVLEASLDNIELLRILDIKQDAEEISFDILVSCDIEIGDYAYRETLAKACRCRRQKFIDQKRRKTG